MAMKRVSPSKTGRPKAKFPKESPELAPAPMRGAPRPHRDDTPEAIRQRARMPKTHPRRSAVAVRKDKVRRAGG
jgi:hypothetical protein